MENTLIKTLKESERTKYEMEVRTFCKKAKKLIKKILPNFTAAKTMGNKMYMFVNLYDNNKKVIGTWTNDSRGKPASFNSELTVFGCN